MQPKHPRSPAITFVDGTLTLTHLVFHADHPQRWRTTVGMAVRAAAARAGVADPERGRTRRRRRFSTSTGTCCCSFHRAASAAGNRNAAAAMLADVAALQLATLDEAEGLADPVAIPD